MVKNPYEDASKPNPYRKGVAWIAVCAVVLAAVLTWAFVLRRPDVTMEFASEATGHIAPSTGKVTLLQTVKFAKQQQVEEYDVTSVLHLLGEDGRDKGTVIVGGRPIGARESVKLQEDGTLLTLPVTFDTRTLAGKTVSCLSAIEHDDATVVSWNDVQDEARMVRFPKLTASFTSDEGRELLGSDSTRISVEASYENVELGKTYQLKAALLDSKTGEPLHGVGGYELAATEDITPGEANGKKTLAVEMKSSDLAGKGVGLQVTLSLGSTILASYETGVQEGLTVPVISSTADVTSVDKERDVVTVKETVSYEGLIPGETYVLKGSIRDGESGSVILGANGSIIKGAEATVEFTPANPAGTVEVIYEISSQAFTDRGITFHVSLARKSDGRVVATWDGLAEKEIVRLPTAKSVAVGGHTGETYEPATVEASIRSIVSYDGLVPGKEYGINGALHLRLEDGSDGGPVMDGSNEVGKVKTTFVPTEKDGTVELLYEVDATDLAGKTLATVETITLDGSDLVGVSTGNPISIAGLTVSMVDAKTGLHETMASGDTNLLVTVEHMGILASDESTIKCTLLDINTGREILDVSGAKVSKQGTVTSNDEGKIELSLKADTRSLAGHAIAARVTAQVSGNVVATATGTVDKNAVVNIPLLQATLTDSASGEHVSKEGSTLVATITCEGLLADVGHTVFIALVDARSGDTIMRRDGRELAEIATIEAGSTTGTATITIPLDADGLAGKSVSLSGTLSCGDTVTAKGPAGKNDERTVQIEKDATKPTEKQTNDKQESKQTSAKIPTTTDEAAR